MQTFLPLPDFQRSLRCLDVKRLGKQRLEADTLIRVLQGELESWRHHPACLMWEEYIEALKFYRNLAVMEWRKRGYKNNMPLIDVKTGFSIPFWFGQEEFHASHRSNLLRKDPSFYSKYGWKESPDLPYIWPVQLDLTKEGVRKVYQFSKK